MENREVDDLVRAIKASEPNVRVEFGLSLVESRLYKFHIVDRENKTKGFGASFNIHEAFLKARSEYYERKVFLSEAKKNRNIWSSSGFACHPDLSKAELNSLCEVVERDAFLLSWLVKCPPVWIDLPVVAECIPEFDPSIFNKQGIELKLGFVAKVGDIFVAVSCILLEKNSNNLVRFAIDTSASQDFAEALRSVYKGALIRLESVLYSERKVETRENSPLYHFFHNADSWTPSEWFVLGGDNLIQYQIPEYAYRRWEMETDEEISHVVFCEAQAQKYFVGSTVDSKISLERLFEVFPEFSLTNLNRNVHPLP